MAEGIETAEEAALLTAQGWRHGQGWLYGRPAERPIGMEFEAAARRKGLVEGWG